MLPLAGLRALHHDHQNAPGDGSTPSRWIDFRNRGKTHVLFVDGHTEVFEPADFKVKHVALGF